MMKIIVLVLIGLAFVNADQYVPIPSQPYGFSIGATDGHFHV